MYKYLPMPAASKMSADFVHRNVIGAGRMQQWRAGA